MPLNTPTVSASVREPRCVQALLACAACLLLAGPVDALTPRYRAEPLALLPGGQIGKALDINASGVAVGGCDDGGPDTYHFAVAWPTPTAAVLIGGSGISVSDAHAIADDGTVVGLIDELGSAFTWSPGGPPTPLAAPGNFSRANEITSDGMIIGLVDVPSLSHRGAAWSSTTRFVTFDPVEAMVSEAHDATGNVVVGSSGMADGRSVPTRWVDGVAELLIDLGGAFGSAYDISEDATTIVGEAWSTGHVSNAFRIVDDVITILPTLGGTQAVARDYDDVTGFIVGRASSSGLSNFSAAIWIDGSAHNLNDLIVTGLDGAVLNNATAICNGYVAANAATPFRLVPLAPGDIDGDGIIGVEDLIEVILQWGPCPPGESCFADVDQDGIVGVDDLLTVIIGWD